MARSHKRGVTEQIMETFQEAAIDGLQQDRSSSNDQRSFAMKNKTSKPDPDCSVQSKFNELRHQQTEKKNATKSRLLAD